MAKAIFNVLFKIIKSFLNIILLPINALMVGFFPDFSNAINNFTNAVNTYIGAGLGYFAHMLPPTTRVMILIYLGVLVTYYTISLTAHGFLKVINIIKKIKIW